MTLTEIDLSKNAKDATLTPAKISTNPADTFTFPANLTVNGDTFNLGVTTLTDDSSFGVLKISNSNNALVGGDSGSYLDLASDKNYKSYIELSKTAPGNTEIITIWAGSGDGDFHGLGMYLDTLFINGNQGRTNQIILNPNTGAIFNTLLSVPLITDPLAINAIDVTNRYLKDTSNLIAADWLNRLLYASDGTTQQVNWNTPGTVEVNAILDATGHSIIHVADPVNSNDAANKIYVDTVAQGLLAKAASTAGTTTVLPAVTPAGSGVGKTLTANSNGVLSVDGINVWVDVVNDGGSTNPTAANPASRVLVKNQANPVDNGIYCVTDKGSVSTPFILTRAIDFDGSPSNEVQPGDFTFIGEGTINANSGWTVVGSNPIVVDTDPIDFVQFSGAGQIIAGNGLTKTGNQLDVNPLDTSLTVHIGDISVTRDPAGALGLTGAGIKVNTDGTYIGISSNNVTLLNPGQHTVAGSNTQIQYNSSGNFGADANFTWNGTTLAVNGNEQISQTGGTGLLLTAPDFTGLTGPSATVTSGTSGSAGGTTSGGTVTLTSGNGNGSSSHLNGAALTLTTGTLLGDNGFANGGSITLTTGNETGGGGGGTLQGGSITLTTGSPGAGGTATGGNVILTSNTPANGGNLTLTGTGASHGKITAGGNMAIDGATFNVDSVNHRIGINIAAPTDLVTVFGTNSNLIKLTGAAGSGTNLTAPGITLSSGDLSGGGSFSTTGGDITLTSGSAPGTNNRGGNITLTSGNGFANFGGSLTLTSGSAAGGGSATGGNVTLTCGNTVGPTSDNIGGSLTLTTGNITGAGSGHATRGGSILLTSGTYSTGGGCVGGGITLTSGVASGGGGFSQGGSILLTSGGGGSNPDSGGNITLTSATAANGGNLILTGTGASHGKITAGGNMAIDGTTLNVDSVNHRVGIGTATPSYPLDVEVNAYLNGMTLGTNSGVQTIIQGNNIAAANTVASSLKFYSSQVAITCQDPTSPTQLVLQSNNANLNKPFVVPDSTSYIVVGNSVAASSAMLQVDSTTKGFLPPRMTTAQRNAISSPATGLVIYNTDTNILNLYNGSVWTSVSPVINFVTREVPSGTIDGSNTVFTLANTPTAGSEEVFLNGLLQNVGVGNDYTISGATITFANAPAIGSVLLVTYRY